MLDLMLILNNIMFILLHLVFCLDLTHFSIVTFVLIFQESSSVVDFSVGMPSLNLDSPVMDVTATCTVSVN